MLFKTRSTCPGSNAGGRCNESCGLIQPTTEHLDFLLAASAYLQILRRHSSKKGKQCHCCCNPGSQHSTLSVTEEDSLHYSSLRHPDKPRPSVRTGPRLVEDLVTYSTVNTRKNLKGLHDHR
ncbi:hypothetical protein ILYODFUR_028281 [Ilyodon furcidens]|uniref:Uncharacterized protein n=1 Tax=Ilyodon furcidens TaxID=33524 RepID=A0ABV0UYA4_9TELE